MKNAHQEDAMATAMREQLSAGLSLSSALGTAVLNGMSEMAKLNVKAGLEAWHGASEHLGSMEDPLTSAWRAPADIQTLMLKGAEHGRQLAAIVQEVQAECVRIVQSGMQELPQGRSDAGANMQDYFRQAEQMATQGYQQWMKATEGAMHGFQPHHHDAGASQVPRTPPPKPRGAARKH